MPQLSADRNFHYEVIRSLGLVRYLGGDIGEQLATVDKIIPGDSESWYREWSSLAQDVLSTVNDPSRHDAVSLRDAYYRASHYFFVADFFLHGQPNDSRLRQNFDLWRKYFDLANAQLSTPGKHYTVPTPHGFSVPVIVYRAPQRPSALAKNNKRTLLLGGGFDSNYEEVLHVFGYAALERGYNVIIYEGPGQPRLLQEQQKGFLYDWEKVVTPIIDFVQDSHKASGEDLSYIDPTQIALLGMSLGGYLAARAAAFEPRLAACILIDGVCSFIDCCLKAFPEIESAWVAQDKAAFDGQFEALMTPSVTTDKRWIHDHLKYSMQKESGFECFQECAKMTLEGGVAQQIKMPTFVGLATRDIFFKGQPEQVKSAIGDHASLMVFDDKLAASAHCASGALNHQNLEIFAWLQGVWKK